MRNIYAIEGTICAGKSTCLNILRREGFTVFPEPAVTWDEALRNFYNSLNSASAINVQENVLEAMEQRGHVIANKKDREPESVCIMERSLASTLHVFTQNNMFTYPSVLWGSVYSDAVMKAEQESREFNVVYIGIVSSWETIRARTKARFELQHHQFDEKYCEEIYRAYQKFFHNHCRYLIDGDAVSPLEVARQVEFLIRHEETPPV